jgi:hypothetical protein
VAHTQPTRSEVEETLAKVAGPLGPFVSIDEYLSSIDRWIDGGGPELIDTLLEIASDPAWHRRFAAFTPDELDGALSDVLCRASARYPSDVPDKAGPFLDDGAMRLLAIDAIGAAGSRDGLPWLGRLIASDAQLDDEEALHLAEAIADIGSSEGRALLVRMISAMPDSVLRRQLSELLEQTDWSDEE